MEELLVVDFGQKIGAVVCGGGLWLWGELEGRLGWSEKVGFRRVSGKSLGRFWGLKRREFWKGCYWVLLEILGDAGMILGWFGVGKGGLCCWKVG